MKKIKQGCTVCWWSAGATSAVATKLALEMYDNVEIFYIGIKSAHPDNARFISDCEKWYGQKIHFVENKKGFKDQFEVIEKTRFINGAMGARCSLELKKEVRFYIEEQLKPTHQVFGFEYEAKEINRAIRFKEQYPKSNPLFPLIDRRVSGEEAHAILLSAGIELPEMYRMGYNNNNCIGCVKGGKGYWNKIREDFPEVFNRMAKLEREIGRSCIREGEAGNKRQVFLDELTPGEGVLNPIVPSCGMFCQVEFAHIMDDRVSDIMDGGKSINEI